MDLCAALVDVHNRAVSAAARHLWPLVFVGRENVESRLEFLGRARQESSLVDVLADVNPTGVQCLSQWQQGGRLLGGSKNPGARRGATNTGMRGVSTWRIDGSHQ